VFAGVFGRHASAYRSRLAAAAARGEVRGRARLVELLGLRAGSRVLDLGCGPGVLSGPLRAAVGPGGLVLGVDLAPGMLALASTGSGSSFARMDIERLGLAGDSFDGVACGHALHFCPDLGRALAEARRVLRPGGRFAASVPGPGPAVVDAASRLLDEVVSARVPANAAERPPDLAGTLAVLAERDRMLSALGAAGLREASVELVEERSTYSTPDDLVEHRLGWWSCAWRLEALATTEREALREEAVRTLRARLGGGPVVVPGASWVLSGTR
jgi:SAM-dependent methyltransferase